MVAATGGPAPAKFAQQHRGARAAENFAKIRKNRRTASAPPSANLRALPRRPFFDHTPPLPRGPPSPGLCPSPGRSSDSVLLRLDPSGPTGPASSLPFAQPPTSGPNPKPKPNPNPQPPKPLRSAPPPCPSAPPPKRRLLPLTPFAECYITRAAPGSLRSTPHTVSARPRLRLDPTHPPTRLRSPPPHTSHYIPHLGCDSAALRLRPIRLSVTALVCPIPSPTAWGAAIGGPEHGVRRGFACTGLKRTGGEHGISGGKKRF